MYNLDTSDMEDWLVVDDFNMIRSPKNRNKLGGSATNMLLFKDLIQHLDMIDFPFEGNHFTWSNIQDDPLLVKLRTMCGSRTGGWSLPCVMSD
jgi:hypothetical protein